MERRRLTETAAFFEHQSNPARLGFEPDYRALEGEIITFTSRKQRFLSI